MTYSQTLAYLFSQLPVFQRVGGAAYKADLTNTIRLCEVLSNPQKALRCVHVGGTNGKGSTSHLIASVLQEAGYKTGLYTSPHLKDFRERIKINGEMISEAKVIQFVEEYKADFESIGLSFFEWTVGLAFHHFNTEKVDVAVIEVGMGGRLDSTNIILPDLTVITNVSHDHNQFLGDTLEQIAIEKAGIIKENTPIVVGERDAATEQVFISSAKSKNASICFASDYASPNVKTDLNGAYQKKNVLTAYTAIEKLNSQGYAISAEAIKNGFSRVKLNTSLQGRWHKLSEQPLVICDVAHNEAGIREVVIMIGETPHDNLHFVIGVVADKSIEKIITLLPQKAHYYVCRADIPRALPAKELYDLLTDFGFSAICCGSVNDALSCAKENAGFNDLIFIGGSTFVVAEIV
ncbi:MAG: bifunctional folylpolyglutamate synthase/dihydrofolate synthase [Flavobacteriales bacterium]